MIYRSSHAELKIPEVSFSALLLKTARARGDHPALIDGLSGRVLTYAQLVSSVRATAAGLAQRSLKKGEVIAIMSPNAIEFPIAFLAAVELGAAVTTVNPLCTDEEVVKQLNDAGARFLVTIPALADRVPKIMQGTRVEESFVFGEAAGCTPFSSLQIDADPPVVSIDPRHDVVALPYSSGTTGLPKGVMLTHHNLIANLMQIDEVQTANAHDRTIAVLPFFHIYGLVVVLGLALYRGATVITLPRFELEPFLKVVSSMKVTRAYLVPPIILLLAKHPLVDQYDLSLLRLIFSGAAPLDIALSAACTARIGSMIVQGYGMTETSPVTHITRDDPAYIVPGSVGTIAPNTECKVVDVESGAELEAGERGEICVRGPQVMKGYHENPSATAAIIDADGWLHTGDIGYADPQGYFFIVDRKKELIKYKGYQVPPAELEGLLIEHPLIADAAVIGLPDEEAGEIPKAFVVLTGAITAEEIMAYIAARVAPHKRIRQVEVIDVIPKSATGKILRRVLIERERAQRS